MHEKLRIIYDSSITDPTYRENELEIKEGILILLRLCAVPIGMYVPFTMVDEFLRPIVSMLSHFIDEQ